MSDKIQHVKGYLLSWVTFFCFIVFTIYGPSSSNFSNWKTFAYGVMVVALLFLAHEGLKIFTNLRKEIHIFLFLFQIVIACILLVFSILKNSMIIFPIFAIAMIISFIFSIYLELKKAKD